MQLFVIRHAIAEDAAPGQSDDSRELTPDGARKLKQVAKGLRELGWRFERVLTSPWQRATRTAELLASLCEADPLATELLCQRPSGELLELIARSSGPTAVVGHEPWLGELVSWLAFGDSRHGEALELKKGGVVQLEGTATPAGMMIRALVPPRVLRAVR
jgi:phosphohistidine phosphatase